MLVNFSPKIRIEPDKKETKIKKNIQFSCKKPEKISELDTEVRDIYIIYKSLQNIISSLLKDFKILPKIDQTKLYVKS